jgi:RNA polymerase sigma-70 factor (ECF subfamily)
MPNWQDSEDSELIKFAQEGESEAFGELYQRYAQTIFRFIYANLNDRLDAEDLTEEVFFRTWRSLPKYRQKEYHSWPISLKSLAMCL